MTLNRLFLLFVLLFWLPANLFAEIPEQFKDDFSPINGVIVMPIGDEFIIDLDSSSNLKQGDILSLTTQGEQIIHPITKEVLGTLEEVHGYLQVTQIKSGFSYARLLSSDSTPKKGDQVKRYNEVPAALDATLAGTPLAAELKSALPQLKWLQGDSSQAPLLTFSLKGAQLNVINSEGVVTKAYTQSSSTLTETLPRPSVAPSTSFRAPEQKKGLVDKTVDGILGVVGLGDDDRLNAPAPQIIRKSETTSQNEDNWVSPNLGSTPVGITVADFDNDGQLETAVATEDKISIYRIAEGKFKPVSTIDIPGGHHLLSIDSLDLDNNGSPEIYVTANKGIKLSSLVVEYQGNSYRITHTGIPWFLRVVDLAGKGKVLLGQELGDKKTPFSQPSFTINKVQDKLARGAFFSSTGRLNLLSLTSFYGEGKQELYATISPGDYLSVVTPGDERLWESGEHFGGTMAFFYPSENLTKEIVQPIYIQKRLVRLPSGEILVPQNEGYRTFKRFRSFTQSRVVAMQWNGFALNESWHTSDQGGYLADFTVADADNDGKQELLMAVEFSTNYFLQKGRSTLVIYELEN